MFTNKFFTRLIIVFAFVAGMSAPMLAQKDTAATTQQAATPAGGGDVTLGKDLFEANCKQCHAVTDEVVVGPGLKGVDTRHSQAWLIKWIRNNQKLIAAGDAEAVAVYNKYQKSQMTVFESLKDNEILGILAYIKSAAAPVTPVSGGGDDKVTTTESGAGISAEYFNIILFGLIIVLGLVLVVLVLMASLLHRTLNDKTDLSEADKEIVNPVFDLGKFFGSRPMLIGIGMLAFLVFTKVGLDSVMNIGIQQGYAPKQPIAFSHKLHAGQYEIACVYCHTTVYKAKGAYIPSANICMNCHNAIKQGSPEIKKIYTAVENDQPIEWVRVHNLPDLAYFNHSQHTNVAGLDCTNCHGEIKQMEVVQQYSPLTMGWCIDCHRKTAVNTKDNAYYDRLLEYHNKASKGEEMKVVNIGGLECSKCHY
jgi:cytochrome c2